MLDRVGADQRSFSQEELRDVEEELLAAAVAAAPPDQPLPDSGTATLALCGALAPIADHLRQQAGPSELRPHVAELGAAAATFLIALSTPGPSLAEFDNARRAKRRCLLPFRLCLGAGRVGLPLTAGVSAPFTLVAAGLARMSFRARRSLRAAATIRSRGSDPSSQPESTG